MEVMTTLSASRRFLIHFKAAADGDVAMISESTFVSRMVTISPDAGVADRSPRWDIQVHAAVFGKAPADCLDQVFRLFFGLVYRCLQDFTRFLLHRASMSRRAHTQLALGGFFQLPDGDASHTSMIALMSMIALLSKLSVSCRKSPKTPNELSSRAKRGICSPPPNADPSLRSG